MDILLPTGVAVDARDNQGRTPLHVAATHGMENTIGVLLDAGADGAARTASGETPFDLAEGLRGTEVYRRLRETLTP